MNFRLTVITLVLLLAGCTVNVKPIYNDKEQAKAEAAVIIFHNLHNERRFEEIFAGLDKQLAQSKEEFTTAATEAFNQWGKLQTARLDQAQVFPSNPIQVKMLYKSTFEKGNAQEWFTWNIYGDDVRLFDYRVTAGWDK